MNSTTISNLLDQAEEIYQAYSHTYAKTFDELLESGKSGLSANKHATLTASKHCAATFNISQFEVGLALKILDMPYWIVKEIQSCVIHPTLALDMIRYADSKDAVLRDVFNITLDLSKSRGEKNPTMASFQIVKRGLTN